MDMLGALMVSGPYLFCYDPGFNSPEDEPDEMGQAMHLCIAIRNNSHWECRFSG